MEIGEKFLPIGTVVLLKGGKKELMIMSYCIVPSGETYDKDGKVDIRDQMFDYGGCAYPEGMLTSDQLFAFNHEQIEKIVFKGYETEKQKEISKVLKGGIEERNKRLAREQEEQGQEEFTNDDLNDDDNTEEDSENYNE